MFYSTGDRASSFTDSCPLPVKVGCNVTRRYPLRVMRVLVYQDFSPKSRNALLGVGKCLYKNAIAGLQIFACLLATNE
ncbi:hypothetical protein QUA82_20315 [Microcoleus sp. F8-D3]